MSGSFETSREEEMANSISHGLGALLSVAALVVMIVMATAHSAWHVVSVSLFGASLISLYLASTIYHALPLGTRSREVFRVLDHSFIYVLIAGSYMPWLLVTIRGPLGWTLFGVICSLMVAGIVFQTFRSAGFAKVSLALYVVMGWLICIAFKPLIENTNTVGLAWLVAGGLCYTVGTIFFEMKRKYAHFIWHLFVLGGSACHVIAVIWGLLV